MQAAVTVVVTVLQIHERVVSHRETVEFPGFLKKTILSRTAKFLTFFFIYFILFLDFFSTSEGFEFELLSYICKFKSIYKYLQMTLHYYFICKGLGNKGFNPKICNIFIELFPFSL